MGAALLKILTLVQAGFELKAIVDTVREKEAGGATQKEISDYLDSLVDRVLQELRDAD